MRFDGKAVKEILSKLVFRVWWLEKETTHPLFVGFFEKRKNIC